jgi:hypothetical protein
MSAAAIAKVAGGALLRNKTRSALTTLGVVIGVAAVIAMVAIGEGARRRVEMTFEAMGTNLLIVVPGSATSGGMLGGAGTRATLTWDDLAAIRREATAVATAAPVMRAGAVIQADDQNWTTGVIGTSPDYFEIRSWGAARGRVLDQGDVDGGVKVAVLGATVVEHLWGADFDPAGRVIRIRGNPFVVIGVLDKKGQSPMGQDYDDTVIVPYTAFQTKISSAGLGAYVNGSIFVTATGANDTARAQTQITSLLRDRHHLAPGMDDDFSVRNLSELAAETTRYGDPDHAARCDRGRVACRRRDRNHEHHARQRYRAHTRNRDTDGGWCTILARARPVPRRGPRAIARGRRDRHRGRCSAREPARGTVSDAGRDPRERDCARGRVLRSGWSRVRYLPGTEGLAPRSDRGAEVRVEPVPALLDDRRRWIQHAPTNAIEHDDQHDPQRTVRCEGAARHRFFTLSTMKGKDEVLALDVGQTVKERASSATSSSSTAPSRHSTMA